MKIYILFDIFLMRRRSHCCFSVDSAPPYTVTRFPARDIAVTPPFVADFPPTSFTQQPQGGMEIAGNTKVLLCHANANPPAVYAWTRDGVPLQQRNPSATALRIERIERADIGRYGCIASNSGGAIRSNPVQVDVACECPQSRNTRQVGGPLLGGLARSFFSKLYRM